MTVKTAATTTAATTTAATTTAATTTAATTTAATTGHLLLVAICLAAGACSKSTVTARLAGDGGSDARSPGDGVTGAPDAAADAAADAASFSSDGGPGASDGPAGWRLVWSDEFAGAAGTAVDPAKWAFDVGNNNGWGNGEFEYYTSTTNNAALDGQGNLAITARHETMSGFAYTSARIKTEGKATWTYGRFEARIKVPSGPGMWPAFWMLGDDITTVNWPTCGEVDIVENLGREPSIVHGTMHGPGYSGGAGPTAMYTLPGGARVADGFHVFAVEWEANVIRWYFDDVLYSTKTPASIPAGQTWVFAHPFFLILNLAVGGTWPGAPDPTTVFPQPMLVDYVRVYQR